MHKNSVLRKGTASAVPQMKLLSPASAAEVRFRSFFDVTTKRVSCLLRLFPKTTLPPLREVTLPIIRLLGSLAKARRSRGTGFSVTCPPGALQECLQRADCPRVSTPGFPPEKPNIGDVEANTSMG